MYLRLRTKILLPLFISAGFFFLFYLLFNTNSKLGNAAVLLNNWKVKESINLFEQFPLDKIENAGAVEIYADALFKSGELIKAEKIFKRIISGGENKFDHKIKLAKIFFYLGKLDSSKQIVNEIINSKEHTSEMPLHAECYNILGLISFNKGEYELAKYYQTESLRLSRTSGAINIEADALRQLGVLSWYEGNYGNVIHEFYEPARLLYLQCGDKIGEATIYSNIGLIYQTQGDWIENLKFQLRAFQLRRKIYDQIGLCDSYYFLTFNIPYKDAGRSFAYKFYKKSFDLSRQIGYSWGSEIALRCLLDIHSEAVNNIEFTDLKSDSLIISSFEGRLHQIWRKAMNYASAGELLTSAAFFRYGFNLCDSMKYYNGIEAPLLEYSDVLISLGAFKEAEHTISKAINMTRSSKKVEGYAESLFNLAKLQTALKNYSSASNLFTRLIEFYDSLYIDNLNRVYPSLAFEAAAGSVHYMRAKIFKEYFEMLKQTNQNEKSFEVVEKERLLPFWGVREYENNYSRADNNSVEDLINVIEQAESEDYYTSKEMNSQLEEIYKKLLVKKDLQFDISSFYSGQGIPTVNELMSVLDPDEILLEYFVTGESTFVFAMRDNSFHLLEVEIPTNQIASVVDIFNETILMSRDGVSLHQWKEPAKKLYDVLINPLVKRNLFDGIEHVNISAHQFMHSINFGTLMSTTNSVETFLVQDYSISYVPSANYLYRQKKKKNDIPLSIAFFAPDHKSLPFTEKESLLIDNLAAGQKEKLIYNQATAGKFLDTPQNTGILHVAAHGLANRKHPLNSFLSFSDRKLFLHEILGMKLNCSLVMLSACETGLSVGSLGIYPGGHDLVSFPRAFISAGCSNVIAPLWIVEDESTYLLMKYFYDHFFDGELGKHKSAVSLAKAQRVFIEKYRGTKRAEPFYWGSFFLTGYTK